MYKSIRFSLRGRAQEHCPAIMNELTKDGIGVFVSHGHNESVYFKPAPIEDERRRELSL